MPERIYNPITAMGFSAIFTFQLGTLRGKYCRHPIAVMGVVDTTDSTDFKERFNRWAMEGQQNLVLYNRIEL